MTRLTRRKCVVRGHAVFLEVESAIERVRAATYETKEPETLDWIEACFEPGDVFFDIGANVGLYSLYAAKVLAGDCRVYAFEPEALNFARLNRHVYINSFSGIIFPACIALTDRLCINTFNLNAATTADRSPTEQLVSGMALHAFGTSIDYAGMPFTPFHKQLAVGASLDWLLFDAKLPFPAHIKIDVDGLEDAIIQGAARTLADPRLRSLLIETSLDRPKDRSMVDSIEAAGLRMSTALSAPVRSDMPANKVFVRDHP